MSKTHSITGSLLRGGLVGICRTRRPVRKGRVRVKGPQETVEILLDRWGVPHIYGRLDRDVLFAQGYLHAQERLWQMDINRRIVAGRLSELFGLDALDLDISARTLGLRRAAEREAGLIEGPARELVEAYCDGVNACVVRERLPIEFLLLGYRPEPWTLADVISWNKLMFLSLATSWDGEFLRGQLREALGPEKTAMLEVAARDAWPLILDAGLSFTPLPGKPWLGSSPRDGIGSNNWVLSGSRSASGMPLLANDMHMGLTTPAIFYQNHLCTSNLNVIGVSFPGVPFVVQGHNGRVAWGFTNGFADVQDLYVERLRGEGTAQEYALGDGWHPVKRRSETIEVKGGSSHVLDVLETSHGPLINAAFLKEIEPTPPPLALAWTGFQSGAMLDGLHQMNLARDCAGFREALRGWHAPVQNVVYADVEGNIGYTQAGDIPIRARGDGSAPMPGWDGEHEWVGQIPFDELPHLSNPARGYIVTANNRVAGPDYPYFLGSDYISRDRAQRITELIEERPLAGLDWMKRMQFDQVSPTGRVFARVAGEVRAAGGVDGDLVAMLDLLAGWDGALGVDSPAAVLYEALAREMLRIILDGKLAGLEDRVRGKSPSGLWEFHAWEWLAERLEEPGSPWWDLGQGEGRDAVFLLALRAAVEFLREILGPDMLRWWWGKLHQLTFGHVLGRQAPLDQVFNQGPYPVGGDGSTVWATHSSRFSFENDLITGPPFRFLIDMADPDHAQVIFAPGQSGRLSSPHYGDGIAAWFSGEYHPLLFRRDEIEKNTKNHFWIGPELSVNPSSRSSTPRTGA